MPFCGARVTVMGLGRFGGGVGAARFLARRGARVTVVDRADPTTLTPSLAALQGEAIENFRFGPHQSTDFTRADYVVASPAVRPDDRFLAMARRAGACVTTEIELLIQACPARIIGITGTNGKSTTAAMTAHVARHLLATDSHSAARVWLGGNIGGSLLQDVERMRPADCVVLEMSSFQLYHLDPATRRPDVAVVTGCVPNHIDWHGTFDEYVAAKQRILAFGDRNQRVVLAPGAEELATWRSSISGQLIAPPDETRLPPLTTPGHHNAANARCAIAAAVALLHRSPREAGQALPTFTGLPMRMESVATIDGVHYINDSAATTPESVSAVLAALKNVWLLVGGASKGADIAPLTRDIVRQAQGAAFFGSVRDNLQSAVRAIDARFPCAATPTLEEALAWCRKRAMPGDHIVLSPGFASLDQYLNYEHRGECFNRLVRRLAA